jgi:hypothetical protein
MHKKKERGENKTKKEINEQEEGPPWLRDPSNYGNSMALVPLKYVGGFSLPTT